MNRTTILNARGEYRSFSSKQLVAFYVPLYRTMQISFNNDAEDFHYRFLFL